jgi:hypothetical protein
MPDRGGLAVNGHRRPGDRSAERGGDALMAETHAEDWLRALRDDPRAQAEIRLPLRMAGPGEMMTLSKSWFQSTAGHSDQVVMRTLVIDNPSELFSAPPVRLAVVARLGC